MKRNLIYISLIAIFAINACQKEFAYFSNDPIVQKVTPKQALISAIVSLPSDMSTLAEIGIAYATDEELTANKFTEQKAISSLNESGQIDFILKHLQCGTKYNCYIYVKSNGELHKGNIFSFKTIDKPSNAVDLGLPSDILWADRNVGADSPEKHGGSYAFGETETKADYTGKNYKFFSNYNPCKDFSITKYTIQDGIIEWPWYNSNGDFLGDNKFILDREDDVVTKTMGDGWRMPLPDDFTELNQNCNISFAPINNTKGLMFKADNGNAIILPPTVQKADGKVAESEGCCFYRTAQLWTGNRSSSTVDLDSSSSMIYFILGEKNQVLRGYSRYAGISVRGVYDCSVLPSEVEEIKVKTPETYVEPDFPQDNNASIVLLKAGDPSVNWSFDEPQVVLDASSDIKGSSFFDFIVSDPIDHGFFTMFMFFEDITKTKIGEELIPISVDCGFSASSYSKATTNKYFGSITLESFDEQKVVIRFDKVMLKLNDHDRYFVHGLASCYLSEE